MASRMLTFLRVFHLQRKISTQLYNDNPRHDKGYFDPVESPTTFWYTVYLNRGFLLFISSYDFAVGSVFRSFPPTVA